MSNITELAQQIENSEARFEENARLRMSDEQKNALEASEAVKEVAKKLGDADSAKEFSEKFGEILSGGYARFIRERNIFDKIRDYAKMSSGRDNDSAALLHTQSIANQFSSGSISVQDIMATAGAAMADAEKSGSYASFLSSIIASEIQSIDGVRREIESDIKSALKRFAGQDGVTDAQKAELAAKVIGAMPIVFQSLESRISAASVKNETLSAELESVKKRVSDFNGLSLFARVSRAFKSNPV